MKRISQRRCGDGRKGTIRAIALGSVVLSAYTAVRAADAIPHACGCTADTTLFVDGEGAWFNAGAAVTLRAGGPHAYALMQFDLSAVRGRKVTRASLRLYRVREALVRTAISTVATERAWMEGDGDGTDRVIGAACWSTPVLIENPERSAWWGRPGSNLGHVTFGNGGSRWTAVVPRFDNRTNWYSIDIPPAMVQAMIDGLQADSLLLADDFGRHETAVFLASRESEHPPELVIETASRETEAPPDPENLAVSRDELGLEWVYFHAPSAAGFEVLLSPTEFSGSENAPSLTKLPRFSLPAPGQGPRRALLSFERSARHTHVGVRTTHDGVNWSPVAQCALPAMIAENPAFDAPRLPRHPLPAEIVSPLIVDDGVAASEDGRWIRSGGKTWWDPVRGPVVLESGRNEVVSFQVLLAGGPGEYAVALSDWHAPGPADPPVRAAMFCEQYVKSRRGIEKYAPDIALPIAPGEPIRGIFEDHATTAPSTAQPKRARKVQGVWIDLHVPKNAARGVWRSRVLVLKDGAAQLDVPLELNVVDAALPDMLGFPVRLESRQMPFEILGLTEGSPEAWAAFDQTHRLAHAHRLHFAPTPYRADGSVYDGFAPQVRGEGDSLSLDFSAWDRRFGRFFDGGAFRSLPRNGQPLTEFLLPLNESWPTPSQYLTAVERSSFAGKYHYRTTRFEHQRGMRPNPRPDSYLRWPPESALQPEHVAARRAAAAAFAEHLRSRNWHGTNFAISLANGIAGGERGSWWQLREPAIFDDVRAIRAFLEPLREGLSDDPHRPRIRLVLRDPLVIRDWLDGILDESVVDDAFFSSQSLLLANPQRFGRLDFLPRENQPELGWATLWRSAWQARLAGASGLVIPESLGRRSDWEFAADRAMIYPSPDPASAVPLPSLRLLSLRRFQQDMEMLQAFVADAQGKGIPAGYALATVATVLAERGSARAPRWPELLPVLTLPGQLDVVALEEIRRGLRSAMSRNATPAFRIGEISPTPMARNP